MTVSAWSVGGVVARGGYVLASVVLQPRIGDPILTLSLIPVIAAAWQWGVRGGIAAAAIDIAVNFALMQTIGDHDGLRASQLPRIVMALAIGAGAGWARDVTRRQRALLVDNAHANRALAAARDNLETQVCERTAELTAANDTLVAEVARRREAEEALRRDFEERKQLEARAAAADRLAVVGTLTAGIGHEINNPLAVIVGNLDYVAENLRGADADIAAALRDAQQAAWRTGEIVRNMRVFIHTTTNTQPADVRQVITSVVQMMSNELSHRATLELDIGDVPRVALTESQLGQVLLNLLTNATHALPAKAHNRVVVQVRLASDRVRIRVTDTGVGVPRDVQTKIFEPFFTTKAIGIGTGLGLWVGHHIVTSAGGEIALESSSGFGTTFRIDLPLARALGTPNLAGPLESRRGRLLVIDDDPAIRKALERFLHHRHELVIVDSAKAALSVFERGEKFDAILCDVMMPEMTGVDLYHELAERFADQATRVIFMTGGAFTSNTMEFLSSGRRLIEKPFEPVHLEGMIQEVLRLRAQA